MVGVTGLMLACFAYAAGIWHPAVTVLVALLQLSIIATGYIILRALTSWPIIATFAGEKIKDFLEFTVKVQWVLLVFALGHLVIELVIRNFYSVM